MDALVAMVYLSELQQQADYALSAVEHVNTATRALGNPSERSTATAETFRGLHSFLTHTSNMSRLLWPGDPACRARGAYLCTLLGLDTSRHALKSRRLRDHLEHFDQRLDSWSETSDSHDFVRAHIGPESEIAHMAPKDRLRSFDPDTAVFCFRGERYELGPLVKDIRDLKQRAASVSFRLHMGI